MLEALVASAELGAQPSTAVAVQDAPMHHVVYSDKHLRVFDVDLPPHAVTLYHIHTNDMVGVTLAPGPARDEIPGKPPEDVPADKPQDVWFDPHPHKDVHRVTNLGDSHIRMIAVELLTSGEPADPNVGVHRGKAAGAVQLENNRIRVIRFSLAPGQASAPHTHGTYVLVPLGPGRLANVCDTTEAKAVAIAGFLCVGSEREHAISNVGDEPIDLIEIEIAS